MNRFARLWYGPAVWAWPLLPLSGLFCAAVALRRAAYRWGIATSSRLPVPVVVVGNLTVGGTGKTPLLLWIAACARRLGRSPGIVTRGYGGRAREWPQRVARDSDPTRVGDEAVLLARRSGVPVFAGPDRAAAAHALMRDAPHCDLILSDDGLQHYALGRDREIAVIDGERRFGNGFCLPAGPLRERPGRLREVDIEVINGDAGPGELAMRVSGDRVVKVADPLTTRPLTELVGSSVTAVAGIGNPERFFAMLRSAGLRVEARPFPDHHRFRASDFAGLSGMVVMTEKDAVKCEAIEHPDLWYVPVEARPDPALVHRVERMLTEI